MSNLIRYNYNQAKEAGISISPTKEILELGFTGITINDMFLPDYIIYEVNNLIDSLPKYIEFFNPVITQSPMFELPE